MRAIFISYLTPNLPYFYQRRWAIWEIFCSVCNRVDLCAAAYKLISHVNTSTTSIAFASCGGSGFYCSKHPNHTGHNFEEFPGTLYSSPGLPLVSAPNLNTTFLLVADLAFTILNCVITLLVTIVKNSQELFTTALAYLPCHCLSFKSWHGRVWALETFIPL